MGNSPCIKVNGGIVQLILDWGIASGFLGAIFVSI